MPTAKFFRDARKIAIDSDLMKRVVDLRRADPDMDLHTAVQIVAEEANQKETPCQ